MVHRHSSNENNGTEKIARVRAAATKGQARFGAARFVRGCSSRKATLRLKSASMPPGTTSWYALAAVALSANTVQLAEDSEVSALAKLADL